MNTSLGRPYHDEAETSVDIAALMNRRESFGARLPAGVAVLTVGIDLQVDRAELELVGWGMTESPPVADDGVVLAERAQPRQEIQRNYPGSVLSLVSGSAIKRIKAGVKARR